jgi:hypothetical protein
LRKCAGEHRDGVDEVAAILNGPGPMDALSGSSAEGGFAALFAQGVTAAGVSA